MRFQYSTPALRGIRSSGGGKKVRQSPKIQDNRVCVRALCERFLFVIAKMESAGFLRVTDSRNPSWILEEQIRPALEDMIGSCVHLH